MVVLPGGSRWRFLDAQPSSALHLGVGCSAWDSLARGCDSVFGRGQPHLPLLFRPPHSEHHPDLCAHVSHLKAFRAAEAKGHPVLRASSCSSGSCIGQSGACSHLSALNMGGHGSLGKACFLTIWRWQLLSAFPALLLEIVFFCFLCLWSCVRSMVLKNITWEKTF